MLLSTPSNCCNSSLGDQQIWEKIGQLYSKMEMEGPEILFSPVPLAQVMRDILVSAVKPNLEAQRVPYLTQRLSIPSSVPLTSLWHHLAPYTPSGNHLPNLKWRIPEKTNTQPSYFPFGRLQPTLPVNKKSSMAPSSPKYCQPKYSLHYF